MESKSEEKKEERIRFFMDSNKRCFPIVTGGELYHFGCLAKDTFAKDLASGKTMYKWPKYLDAVEDVCKKLIGNVKRSIHTTVTHVLVLSAKPAGISHQNIFRFKPAKFVDTWGLGTFCFIPILVGHTKSLERIAHASETRYAGFYKAGEGWAEIPCKDCLRYVYCMEKGVATYGAYTLDNCPWFSSDEPVSLVESAPADKVREIIQAENKALVDSYVNEAVGISDAEGQC